jgi:hypothetical protein
VIPNPIFTTSHPKKWDWAIQSIGDYRQPSWIQAQLASTMFKVEAIRIFRHVTANDVQEGIQPLPGSIWVELLF